MSDKNGSAALAVMPSRQDYGDDFLYSMFDALEARGVVSSFHKRTKKYSKRGYDMNESSDLLADWNVTQSSADANIKTALVRSRARARDMERNNDYVKRYLNMSVNNIIGPNGMTLQNRAKTSNGTTLDKRANELIEDSWRRWGEKNICTVDGRQSWHGVEKLTARGVPRDGEVLVRKVFGFDNPWKFALQIFEADRLDIDLDGITLNNGNKIKMGVEMNSWGRPVAYHLLEDHPGDYAFISGGRRTARIPATEITLIYLPLRAEQTRGFPWLDSAAVKLHQMGKYDEAEVVAARAGASKMGVYERGTDAENDPAFDDEENNNPIQELSPGNMEVLPKGWKVELLDPTHPSGNYAPFKESALQGMASGLDVAYVSLANNLKGVNFSSIRQGVIDERNSWRMQQGFIIESLHNWIFPDWLRMSLMTDLAGSLEFSRFDRYNQALWIPRGWEWVDPKKDAEASVLEINNLLNSRTIILAKKGLQLEQVLDDLAREQKMIDDRGLSVTEVNQAVATAAPVEDEDDEEEEDTDDA